MCLILPPVPLAIKGFSALSTVFVSDSSCAFNSIACSPFVTSSTHVFHWLFLSRLQVNISFGVTLIYTYLHYLLEEERRLHHSNPPFILFIRFGRPQNQKRHQRSDMMKWFFVFLLPSENNFPSNVSSNLTSSHFTAELRLHQNRLSDFDGVPNLIPSCKLCMRTSLAHKVRRKKTWLDFSIDKPCAENYLSETGNLSDRNFSCWSVNNAMFYFFNHRTDGRSEWIPDFPTFLELFSLVWSIFRFKAVCCCSIFKRQ